MPREEGDRKRRQEADRQNIKSQYLLLYCSFFKINCLDKTNLQIQKEQKTNH